MIGMPGSWWKLTRLTILSHHQWDLSHMWSNLPWNSKKIFHYLRRPDNDVLNLPVRPTDCMDYCRLLLDHLRPWDTARTCLHIRSSVRATLQYSPECLKCHYYNEISWPSPVDEMSKFDLSLNQNLPGPGGCWAPAAVVRLGNLQPLLSQDGHYWKQCSGKMSWVCGKVKGCWVNPEVKLSEAWVYQSVYVHIS